MSDVSSPRWRLRGPGPLVALFPLDLADTLTVTAAAQVADDVLSGGQFAVATHIGPYDQIPLTAHALLAWAGEHGHTPRGPLREVYLSDPRHSAPEQLVTQVMIKLEEDE